MIPTCFRFYRFLLLFVLKIAGSLPSLTNLLLEAPADSETDALWPAMEEMVESIVAAEFYSSDYAAKEQPQAQA